MYDEFKESKVRSHLVIGTLTLKNISSDPHKPSCRYLMQKLFSGINME